MTSAPDHHDLMDADYQVFKLTQAVEDVATHASRGPAERAALLTEQGAILDAWRRLGDLVELLSLRRAA